MSEPRHLWPSKDQRKDAEGGCFQSDEPRPRYTLTEGPEWDALMERAREALATPIYKNATLKGYALRDLLTYLGEQT